MFKWFAENLGVLNPVGAVYAGAVMDQKTGEAVDATKEKVTDFTQAVKNNYRLLIGGIFSLAVIAIIILIYK